MSVVLSRCCCSGVLGVAIAPPTPYLRSAFFHALVGREPGSVEAWAMPSHYIPRPPHYSWQAHYRLQLQWKATPGALGTFFPSSVWVKQQGTVVHCMARTAGQLARLLRAAACSPCFQGLLYYYDYGAMCNTRMDLSCPTGDVSSRCNVRRHAAGCCVRQRERAAVPHATGRWLCALCFGVISNEGGLHRMCAVGVCFLHPASLSFKVVVSSVSSVCSVCTP